MATPWTAERLVSPDEALSLVRTQFPALHPQRVECMGEGWDNVAYLFDDTWVFRFPRRQIAVELIEIEARVLPAIAPHLPLPVPVPQWVGEPTEAYGWPFVGYRRLAGRTACRAALSLAQREALAKPLAEFLRTLHGLSPEQGPAPADDLDRTNTRLRVPRVRQSLDTIVAAGLIESTAPWEPLLDRATDALPSRDVLVHADLYVRHVLVDEHGVACGVIDWGDVHRGHPGLDFAPAFCLLPPSTRDEFRRVYGEIDEASWALGRQRALLYGAVLADYGHDIDDDALRREGLQALRWVLQ